MKKRIHLVRTTLCASLLALSCAAQATPVSPAIGNLVSSDQIAVDYLNQNYQEQVNGTVPDRESGNIPGISLYESGLRRAGFYYEFGVRYVSGSDTYLGKTQGGTPMTTDTGNTIVDTRGRFGWAFATAPRSAVAPYLTVGSYDWKRGLGGQIPYNEHYSHYFLGAGLLGLYAPSPRLLVYARGSLGRVIYPQMTVSGLSSYGVPDTTFSLGSASRYSVGIGTDFLITQSFRIHAGVDETQFSYGVSSVVAIPGGAIQEPASTTRQIACEIGADVAF